MPKTCPHVYGEEPCGSRRVGFRFNRGASGYDSGPLDGRKKMAAHPCIVLAPERSSPGID
jgi:hypothetical protein